MTLIISHESNPKATVWKSFEKFMSLTKYLLPNSAVAFVDILWINKKWVYILFDNRK